MKKGASAKVLQDNSHHTLAHRQKKVGMKDCGNGRKFYDKITSVNVKSGRNASFDNVLDDHKEARAKRRITPPVPAPDEEDQEHDHVVEECEKIEDKE